MLVNVMTESKVVIKNGNPILRIGNQEFSACAYMTYFDERNDYELFANRGFKIYSITVSLATQPINTGSGFMPFESGIFDTKGNADFSSVDKAIQLIIENCPDAYIFPRIYVCMPQWWIDENISETIEVPHNKRRESMYSEKFRQDGAKMLTLVIEHFKQSEYSDHIFGYQISGANTQEWFHLDRKAGYSKETIPFFNEYLKKNHPDTAQVTELPDINKTETESLLNDNVLTAFLRFASDEMAKTVNHFCKAAKEAVDFKQIVGAFYGYTLEIFEQLRGTHSFADIIDSPYIDFFSSPNSYINSRQLGIDWGDMLPSNSIKLHKKMCFMECDIRTLFSRAPGECRKGSDPYNTYTSAVWLGPETEELSAWAIRKSVARQLTHKHGMWHFDMFGKWYSSDILADELENSLVLYNETIDTTPFEYPAQVAVFCDEKSFSYIGKQHPQYMSLHDMRTPLGQCGAPYEVYLSSDFDNISWESRQYKAVVLIIPHNKEFLDSSIKYLNSKGIATLLVTDEKPMYSASELTDFFEKNGVHIYTDDGDVFYEGNGYMAIHAANEGNKKIYLPETVKCTDLTSGDVMLTDVITFECDKFETRMFKLEKVN